MTETFRWLGSNWDDWEGVEHRCLKRRTSWRGVHIVHNVSVMRSIGFCERQTSGRKYQKHWFIFVKKQLQLSDVFSFPHQSSHFYPGSEGNQTLSVGKLISTGILDEGSQGKQKPSSFKTWGFVESSISEDENTPYLWLAWFFYDW